MKLDNNQLVFFALVKAGLWEQEARLLPYGKVDYEDVMRIAEEQSVDGLITAGLEHLDVRCQKEDGSGILSQEDLLQFIGQALQIEQQNRAMKKFIAELVNNMRQKGIYTLLVKGQAVAQCYERPLWRTCGDVDLFLNDENYNKAKDYLIPLASDVENEYKYNKHQAMTIDSWIVELHGNLRCGLSPKIDKVLDEIKRDTFDGGNVRSWMNEKTSVFLLGIDSDIIYVFTHFLNHFYKGGIGLRQVCDWCRLLFTYKDKINRTFLEKCLKRMGLMTEWRAFGALAVEYLGMPVEAMPFYSPDKKWKAKADKICTFIMEVGNFGQNRDMSYYCKYPYLVRKVISLGRRCGDLIRNAWIFPMDSLRFFPYMMYNGLREAVRG